MTAFETVMAELLLRIIPEPLFWMFALMAIIVVALALTRQPASVSGFFGLLVVGVGTSYFGGIWDIINMLFLAASAVALVWGFMRAGRT